MGSISRFSGALRKVSFKNYALGGESRTPGKNPVVSMAEYVNPLSRALDKRVDDRAHIQHPRQIAMYCQDKEVFQPLLSL